MFFWNVAARSRLLKILWCIQLWGKRLILLVKHSFKMCSNLTEKMKPQKKKKKKHKITTTRKKTRNRVPERQKAINENALWQQDQAAALAWNKQRNKKTNTWLLTRMMAFVPPSARCINSYKNRAKETKFNSKRPITNSQCYAVVICITRKYSFCNCLHFSCFFFLLDLFFYKHTQRVFFSLNRHLVSLCKECFNSSSQFKSRISCHHSFWQFRWWNFFSVAIRNGIFH